MRWAFETIWRYPNPAITLISVITFLVGASRYAVYLLLPDNFNYITYWQQLVNGSFRATSLQTPKPLLILVFGVLWELTHSSMFLIVFFIVIGTIAVKESVRIVDRTCGPAASWLVLLFILPNAIFLHSVLSGYSELLSATGILWLISRHWDGNHIRRPDTATAIGLFTLSLVRPENWLVTAAIALLVTITLGRRFSQKKLASALHGPRSSLYFVILPLLAPVLWIAFDYLAFGDPFFSFEVTSRYATLGAPTTLKTTWYGYLGEIVSSLRNQTSILALNSTALAIILLSREYRPLLAMFALPFIATIAFYFVAYFQGLVLYDRFFLVPIIEILVLTCLALARLAKWFLDIEVPISLSPAHHRLWLLGKQILVGLSLTGVLAIEHHALPAKIAGFDAYSRARVSALSAADAVRLDSDYTDLTPVVVRVEDFALVGWKLHSDGRNLIETQIYAREGVGLFPQAQIVYFIVNQIHHGNLFSDPATDHLLGFHTTTIYNDKITIIYKSARVLD